MHRKSFILKIFPCTRLRALCKYGIACDNRTKVCVGVHHEELCSSNAVASSISHRHTHTQSHLCDEPFGGLSSQRGFTLPQHWADTRCRALTATHWCLCHGFPPAFCFILTAADFLNAPGLYQHAFLWLCSTFFMWYMFQCTILQGWQWMDNLPFR